MEATAPTHAIQTIKPSARKLTSEKNLKPNIKTQEIKKESEGLLSSIISGIINFFKSIFSNKTEEKNAEAKTPKKEIHHAPPKAPKKAEKMTPLEIKELDLVNENISDDKYGKDIGGLEEFLNDLLKDNQGIVLVIDPKDRHIKTRIKDLIASIKGFGAKVIALDYNYGMQPLIDKFFKVERGSYEEKKVKEKLKKVFIKTQTNKQDQALFEALRDNEMKVITTSDIKEPSSIKRVIKRIEKKDKEEDWEEAKYVLILSKAKAESIKSGSQTLDQVLGVPSIDLTSKRYKTDRLDILRGPQQSSLGEDFNTQDYRVEIPKTKLN